MHVLFIHRAFPAQFGRLGLELTKRCGWKCSFLIEDPTHCPPPSGEMFERLDVHRIPVPEEWRGTSPPPWPQAYGRFLELGPRLFETVRLCPDLRPDLVVGHGGLTP